MSAVHLGKLLSKTDPATAPVHLLARSIQPPYSTLAEAAKARIGTVEVAPATPAAPGEPNAPHTTGSPWALGMGAWRRSLTEPRSHPSLARAGAAPGMIRLTNPCAAGGRRPARGATGTTDRVAAPRRRPASEACLLPQGSKLTAIPPRRPPDPWRSPALLPGAAPARETASPLKWGMRVPVERAIIRMRRGEQQP